MIETIDWRRVAAPQEDGYDIRVTLQYLEYSRYANKLKRPPNDAPNVWPEGQARWVALTESMRPSTELHDMPLDNPFVKQGLSLIDTWPAARPLCAHLLLAICPLTTRRGQAGHGCTCGNFGDDWGWIYVTADNPWGFAEGIVHEMGHWKLRTFGIWFEDWTPLILKNSMEDKYTSPVRKDMPRPMGAVLHAQYSYIHVAAMCTAMLKAAEQPTGADYDWTALQLKRITEGQATLREHAVGTPGVGDAFLEGLDDWTTRVLEEGKDAIAVKGLTI